MSLSAHILCSICRHPDAKNGFPKGSGYVTLGTIPLGGQYPRVIETNKIQDINDANDKKLPATLPTYMKPPRTAEGVDAGFFPFRYAVAAAQETTWFSRGEEQQGIIIEFVTKGFDIGSNKNAHAIRRYTTDSIEGREAYEFVSLVIPKPDDDTREYEALKANIADLGKKIDSAKTLDALKNNEVSALIPPVIIDTRTSDGQYIRANALLGLLEGINRCFRGEILREDFEAPVQVKNSTILSGLYLDLLSNEENIPRQNRHNYGTFEPIEYNM